MEVFKGFAHRGQLVNNSPDVVSKVGEISSDAFSFRRDKKLYSSGTYINLLLVGFTQTMNGVEFPFPSASQLLILKASDYVYTQANLGSITTDRESFQHAFIQKFGTELDLISSGLNVNYDSTKFCPEFITIAPKGKAASVQWKVWFSDEAFRNQYDDSEILVSPPIVNLDAFFDTSEVVRGLAVPPDIQGINNRADQAKGSYPYTALRTWMFSWHDPNNELVKIPTFWVTIHYGESGNNSDAAKEAIRDYILKNSGFDREEWAKIFPDIFTSTEFIIVPAFHRIAVPNKERETGIYSPTLNIQDIKDLSLKLSKGVGYTPEHILSKTMVSSSIYKSMAFVAIGGPENRDGIDTLSVRYPDYINVPTTNVDFGYMEEETRDFALLLVNLIRVADELTPSTSIPKGFNRIKRDDVIYVSTNFGNFLYLVASRQSVMSELEP